MNDSCGLTVNNMLLSLPPAFRNDEDMIALATVIAEELSTHMRDIEKANIYSRIDELPEELLDIIAYDFKVDWWDGDYTIEEKRNILKNNWCVHKMLGTKAAVETAISSIYPETKVAEWFEYGGKPYHFKLLVDAAYENADEQKYRRVLDRINCYKNLRSVLDGVEYLENGSAKSYICIAFASDQLIDGAEARSY